MLFTDHISSWVDLAQDDLAVCWDDSWDFHGFPNRTIYWSAMIAARPKHPALAAAVRIAVDRVRTHYYEKEEGKHGDLFVTGPGLLTLAINGTLNGTKVARPNESFRADCVHFTATVKSRSKVKISQGLVYKGGQWQQANLVAIQNESEHMLLRLNKKDYGHLYKTHAVYCDEPGPPCAG